MSFARRSVYVGVSFPVLCVFFFFNDTATTEIYTLSLHDALPILIARDHWFLENAEHETEGSILAAFLVRCYLPLEVRAHKVLLPFPPAPEDLASLGELAPEVDWHVPQRGTKAQLADLADQNARHLLDSLKIESFDIDERAADPVFALGRDLGLAAVPRAFVCIDISTNQGRDTVGSLVWFEAGRPKKAEDRRGTEPGGPPHGHTPA